MQHQAYRPQHRPDVVCVAVVGLLMGENVPADLLVLRCLGGQVDHRAEQSEDAGGGHRFGHINGKQTICGGEFPPAQLQPPAQVEVAQDDHGGHHRHAAQPQLRQKTLQIHLLLCLHQILGGFPDHNGIDLLPGGGIGIGNPLVGFVIGDFIALLVGGYIDLPDGLGDVHIPGDGSGAEIAGEKLHRKQKPYQHQSPQGVLQPQADFAPEQLPSQQHGADQQGRRENPFIHHGAAPPRLCG